MNFESIRIAANDSVAEGVCLMTLEAPLLAEQCGPGQFLMLRTWASKNPYLMRPFSIHSVSRSAGEVRILYRVNGVGTQLMESALAGDVAYVIGPLGNGFSLPEKGRRIALVGRGIGAAPMLFLAEEARAMGMEVYAYLSADSEKALFRLEEYYRLGCTVRTMTDNAQLVTRFFEQDMRESAFDAAYVCGSRRLARSLYGLADSKLKECCYISLEEHMACGTGMCKGCAIRLADGQIAHVCKDGPVFDLGKVVGNDFEQA